MKITENNFVNNFASQFEDTEISLFNLQTRFRDLEEWNSLIALSVMAMIDEEYDVKIKADEMIKSNTIEDLYLIVQAKSN